MILYLGAKGDGVVNLQKSINAYYKKNILSEDGIFGPNTRAVVIKFQKDCNLDMDGVVGPNTWKALKVTVKDPEILKTPNGFNEIIETFGEPWIDGWRQSYLDKCSIPVELQHVKGWERGYFWCNKLVKPCFDSVLIKIAKEKELCSHLKSYGGCFNVRKVRGKSEKWSTHSWAIAWDLNSETNPLGHKGNMHPEIVKIHEDYGFVWGGKWKRPDPMHFQWCIGY